jgi:hypothetical protein
VQEGDFAVASAHTRGLINQCYTFFLQFSQSRFNIFDLKGYMLETAFTTVLLDEFGNMPKIDKFDKMITVGIVKS